jgi:hypothetical protein
MRRGDAGVAATVALSVALFACGAEPTTKSSDPALDWMLAHPTTAPATTAPTTASSPLVSDAKDETRAGTITLSDGTKLTGQISTTVDKPLRVYDENEKQYIDVPIDKIASIKAEVVWERDEKEWQFKLSGSDEKVYSGKTYPARETRYTIAKLDGTKVSGAIAAPIYFKQGEGRRTLVLHKRDKGDVGQTLKQLVYVQSVEFDAASK